ncbi:hypothetical protein MP228_002866 [Amoeboaphelidium protococcarum]|nr:hypothetical protein MP228_002866 [Amoeboaphelidium protococcarum]
MHRNKQDKQQNYWVQSEQNKNPFADNLSTSAKSQQHQAINNPFDDFYNIAEQQAEIQNVVQFGIAPLSISNQPRQRKIAPVNHPQFQDTVSQLDPDNKISNIDVEALEHYTAINKSFQQGKGRLELSSDDDFNQSGDESATFKSSRSSTLVSEKRGSILERTAFDKSASITDILSVPPLVLAQQIALIDAQLFRNVARQDLESMSWTGSDRWTKAPTIALMIQSFNQITMMVSKEILDTINHKRRLQKISHLINVAKQCVKLGDLNGAKMLITGLQHSPVHRLTKTWSLVPKQDAQVFDKIQAILSPEDNASQYRKRLKKLQSPFVPFLGIHLGDLIVLNEVKKKELSKGQSELARSRLQQINREIDVLQQMQARCQYSFEELPPVKQYLLQQKYITELENLLEDRYYFKSLQIEPQKKQSSSQGAPVSPQLDLMDMPLDQMKKALSFDNLSDVMAEDKMEEQDAGRRHGHRRAVSSISQSYQSSSQNDEVDDQLPYDAQSRPKKLQKKRILQSKFQLDKIGGSVVLSVEDVDGQGQQRQQQSVPNVDAPLSSDGLQSQSISPIASPQIRSIDQIDYYDAFSNQGVFKEGTLKVKLISMEDGRKPNANNDWETCLVRLYQSAVVIYWKKPKAKLESMNKDVIKVLELSPQSAAFAFDMGKKKPNVFKLIWKGQGAAVLQTSFDLDLFDWISQIQSCISKLKR